MKVRQVIGRADIIDFPGIGLLGAKVKIDTGADTSAIHASKIKVVERDGNRWLSCEFVRGKPMFFEHFRQTRVKSSNGAQQDRFVVELGFMLFGKIFLADFTLTNRTKMNFPVLLGRRFLRKRFVVDVALKNLSYKKSLKNTAL
ncbi:MAG TPA: RimK/LysX family protein [Luteibaculaceae bacterium]|nr:RimK/LysX family protein [Luteibaculaceae bacterium]